MGRLSFFHRPKTGGAIDRLVNQFREHLHFPDPGPIYLLMGSVAANLIEGDPVWPMIVGPPSCGKTELLNSIRTLKGIFYCADISDRSAFLSATSAKDRADDATGGLLRQVGGHGGLLMQDFTSVLALDKTARDKILAVLRECYSGRWTRSVGAEGARSLHWEGKLALFGGVTNEIEKHQEVNTSLGERWLYYNYPEIDSFERARGAISGSKGEGFREELPAAVEVFFEIEGLKFMGDDIGAGLPKKRALVDAETYRIVRLATVTAKGRSAVSRDSRDRTIDYIPETEIGTRLAKSMSQLYLGMDLLGVPREECWRILGEVALSSMPRTRAAFIKKIAKQKDGATYEVLREGSSLGLTAVTRGVEDLEAHGLVQRSKHKGVVYVRFTDWMTAEWKALLSK